MIIGTKSEFAFEIGTKKVVDLREVNIWAKDTLITYYDNMAYIPAFIASLEREINILESGHFDDEHIFLNYGPTTDDVLSRIKYYNDKIHISFELDNGKKFQLETDMELLLSIYRKTAQTLKEESI